jgi:hypothetical protein
VVAKGGEEASQGEHQFLCLDSRGQERWVVTLDVIAEIDMAHHECVDMVIYYYCG